MNSSNKTIASTGKQSTAPTTAKAKVGESYIIHILTTFCEIHNIYCV